jgi:hypothetical protein
MRKTAQDIDDLFGPFGMQDGGMPQGEISIFVDKDDDGRFEQDEEITFNLPEIPGAPDASEIVIDDEPAVEITEEVQDDNPWNWSSGGIAGFIPWLQKMIEGVPRHSGHDTTGLEKAISYFEALDKEITKAMRQDFKNEINSADAEKARESIENGLERLIDRLEKVKKTKYKRHSKKSKAWYEDQGIVKEAKSTRIGGITITVPLIISRAARVCINGMVSAGHDLEELYAQQVEEYDLNKREQAELSQLLADMGYPMIQDRGFAVGTPVDTTRSDNRDWAANYFG